MPAEILFIDDEEFFARRYIEHLEQHGHKVHYLEHADEVPGYLEAYPSISAIILDIMMPTPAGVSEVATNSGLDTGLWLLKRIKGYVLSRPRPVLILTNRDPLAVEAGVRALELPGWIAQVKRKIDMQAHHLPGHLDGFMKQAHKSYLDEREAESPA